MYQTELEKAIELATNIPREIWHMIPTFMFLGTIETPYGNRHYYLHKAENTYYVESDFDREMRAVIKRRAKK